MVWPLAIGGRPRRSNPVPSEATEVYRVQTRYMAPPLGTWFYDDVTHGLRKNHVPGGGAMYRA